MYLKNCNVLLLVIIYTNVFNNSIIQLTVIGLVVLRILRHFNELYDIVMAYNVSFNEKDMLLRRISVKSLLICFSLLLHSGGCFVSPR